MAGKSVSGVCRFVRHVFSLPWQARRYFPPAALQAIEAAIAKSEATHQGELRFVVETALHPVQLWHGVTPRQRAIALFSELGVWDTAGNNGMLIYLSLADHDVEIVADRGIDALVGAAGWETICHSMEQAFRAGRFSDGVLDGIQQISAHLAQHFPAQGAVRNELPDAPLVL
ncbi:TPM domain-containing protein [Methylobacillus flagellatus]|uniref:TPM domain-containing protein n=1 Tax=Methylobacillus flagellatus TaxID=405 RepID=UPI00148599E1|nr:TPM domain-containing protein [Methylobacillus flagellatus]